MEGVLSVPVLVLVLTEAARFAMALASMHLIPIC